MIGVYRHLVKREGKRTAILILAALGTVLFLGGGAYAAFYGGTPRQASSSDINLQKGLIGWWKMDGNAKDSTINRNNGTESGNTGYTADRENKPNAAKLITTSAGYVRSTNNGIFNFTNAISVSSWIQINGTMPDWAGIVTKGQSAWQLRKYVNTAGNIDFHIYTTGNHDLSSTVALNDGKWHHVVGEYDGSHMYLYIDGQLNNSVALTGTINSTTAPVWIGNNSENNGALWNGAIDDARVYNRALSAAEIKALYDQYDPAVASDSGEKGLVGWWKMDGNLKDSSIFRHDATMLFSHTPTYTTDREGRTAGAQLLNGSNDGDAVSANLFSGSSDFTLSVWVNNTSLNDGNSYSIMGNYNGGGNEPPGLDMRPSNGTIRLWLYSASGTYEVQDVANYFTTTGQWTHIVETKSGTALKLYRNGSLFFSTTLGDATIFTANTYDIGTIGNYWKGSLDDVRIYNRALSAGEVAAQYASYNSQINVLSNPTTSTTGGNINQSLVGYWNFNGNAHDSTIYRDNGTVSGPALATDRKGRAGSAYSFSANTDVIALPANAALNATSFTFAAWVKPTSFAANETIIGSSSDNGPQFQIRSSTAGSLALNVQGTVQICNTAGTAIPLNVWSHVVVSYTGSASSCKFYINGVLYNAGGTANTFSYSSLNIGKKSSTSETLVGSIDEVRIYNRVLSQTEVTALYTANN